MPPLIVNKRQHVCVVIMSSLGCPSPATSVSINGASVGSINACSADPCCFWNDACSVYAQVSSAFYNSSEALGSPPTITTIDWPASKSSTGCAGNLGIDITSNTLMPTATQNSLQFLNKSSINSLTLTANVISCTRPDAFGNPYSYCPIACPPAVVVQILAKWQNQSSWTPIWQQHFWGRTFIDDPGGYEIYCPSSANIAFSANFAYSPTSVGCQPCTA